VRSKLAETEGLPLCVDPLLRWPASLLRRQPPSQHPFQIRDELLCAERADGVGATAGRFRILVGARKILRKEQRV
jgi:hypothetical protein